MRRPSVSEIIDLGRSEIWSNILLELGYWSIPVSFQRQENIGALSRTQPTWFAYYVYYYNIFVVPFR